MMIYIDTRREFWRTSFTAVKFGLSTVLLGLAGCLIFASLQAYHSGHAAAYLPQLSGAIMGVALLKMAHEATIFNRLRKFAPLHSLRKSAQLMVRELAIPTKLRFLLGILGGVILPVVAIAYSADHGTTLFLASAVGALTLTAEGLERYLFFRAVVALKMPGGQAA